MGTGHLKRGAEGLIHQHFDGVLGGGRHLGGPPWEPWEGQRPAPASSSQANQKWQKGPEKKAPKRVNCAVRPLETTGQDFQHLMVW